jgi:hypothetical protein
MSAWACLAIAFSEGGSVAKSSVRLVIPKDTVSTNNKFATQASFPFFFDILAAGGGHSLALLMLHLPETICVRVKYCMG